MRFLATLLMLLALGVCQGVQAQSAQTPVGTPIRNQASASYTDPNGQPGAVLSNTVTSTVQQVYGLSIKPDAGNTPTATTDFSLPADPSNDRVAVPGSSVTFAYTVTNTGNGADGVALQVGQFAADGFDLNNPKIIQDLNQNGLADPGEPTISALNLAAGARATVVVTGTVPGSAITGSSAKLDLSGSSQGAPSVTDNNNIAQVNVLNDAILTLNKTASGPDASGLLRYRLFGSNTGVQPAQSRAGAAIVDGVLLDGILIDDAIPTGTTLSLLETPTGSSGGVGSTSVVYFVGTDWTTTPSASATRIGLLIRDANPTTFSPENALAQNGLFELQFAVRPNAAAPGGSIVNNTGVVQYRDQSGTNQQTTSNTTSSTIPTIYGTMIGPWSQPEGPASGTYALPDPGTGKTWTITRLGGVGGTGDEQTIASTLGSNTVSFLNTVRNTGNATDSFTVGFDASDPSNTLPAGTLVQLWQPDGLTPFGGTINLAAGADAAVLVRIVLPSVYSTGGMLSVAIRSRSQTDTGKTDLTRNRVLETPFPKPWIGPLGLPDATEYPNPADQQALEVFQGGTLRFRHTLKNGGNVSDTLNVALETPLPANWVARWYRSDGVTPLTDSNGDGLPDVGVLAAGAVVDAVIALTPPVNLSGSNAGVGWNFVVRTASSADPAQVNRSLDVVGRIRPASDAWVLEKQVSPTGAVRQGSTLEYTLILRNTSGTDQANVTVRDTLDGNLGTPSAWTNGTALDATAGSSLNVQGSFDANTRTLTWTFANLPAGASVTLRFGVPVKTSAPDASVIVNRAQVSSQNVPADVDSNTTETDVIGLVLTLEKRALEPSVAVGGVTSFELVMHNASQTAVLTQVLVTDSMPLGLVYRSGSSLLDGRSIPDPQIIERDGKQVLRWLLPSLAPKATSKIRFAAIATAQMPFEVTNVVNATAQAGVAGRITVTADQKTANVKQTVGLFTPRATIVGRVFFDVNDNGRFDPGTDRVLGNARVYLSTGRYAITDDQGRYSLPDVAMGSYALRLDPLTVPFIPKPIPEDQCAPGTRTARLEGAGIYAKDFPLVPPGSVSAKVRSTVLRSDGLVLEKRIVRAGAGYAVTLRLKVDRQVSNLTLEDALPTGGSSPAERASLTVQDTTGKPLPFSLSSTGTGLLLGTLAPGEYVISYALFTDLSPEFALTDPSLDWDEPLEPASEPEGQP